MHSDQESETFFNDPPVPCSPDAQDLEEYLLFLDEEDRKDEEQLMRQIRRKVKLFRGSPSSSSADSDESLSSEEDSYLENPPTVSEDDTYDDSSSSESFELIIPDGARLRMSAFADHKKRYYAYYKPGSVPHIDRSMHIDRLGNDYLTTNAYGELVVRRHFYNEYLPNV